MEDLGYIKDICSYSQTTHQDRLHETYGHMEQQSSPKIGHCKLSTSQIYHFAFLYNTFYQVLSC